MQALFSKKNIKCKKDLHLEKRSGKVDYGNSRL